MKKITSRKKLLLYGCSGMGVNMMNLIVGSYLCSALTRGSHVHKQKAHGQRDESKQKRGANTQIDISSFFHVSPHFSLFFKCFT